MSMLLLFYKIENSQFENKIFTKSLNTLVDSNKILYEEKIAEIKSNFPNDQTKSKDNKKYFKLNSKEF